MAEPDPSSQREENSVPELTGESERVQGGSRRIVIDRELGKRVISQMRERATMMLELSNLWKDFEKEIELKELALRKKILEINKKEERFKLVEEREKKIELLEVSITEKEKESDLKLVLETDLMRLVLVMENEQVGIELKEQEKVLGLVRSSMVKQHEEQVRELDAKKEEVGVLFKSIDEKSRVFDMRQTVENERMKKEAEMMAISHKQLEERKEEIGLLSKSIDEKAREFENALTERMNKEAEMMDLSHKKLEAREKEVKLLDETIKKKSIELEKKEENFQLKQNAEARVEVKRKFMELQEKKLEERERELELKQREFEERLIQLKTRKRSRRESRSSVLGEKGRDDYSLIRPRKKRKPIREHNHDDEEKETDSDYVLYGETSSGFECEDTSEPIVCTDEVGMDTEPLICPDPDFNDFKNTMSSFAVGQVWALYDPLDEMPRYYARINGVLKQQKSLRVTWLESVQTTENEKPIPIACGKFKYGESETKSLFMFSHEMQHMGRSKNVVITPRKGETWALFRDWKKTEQHKPPYRYDLVEVVSEFHSVQGIGVAYLKRVEEFTSVYEHGEQHGFIRRMISPDKMLSFSHRVPSYKLTGEEKEGVPVGSFELDPAAIPPQDCLNDYALVLV
ncbi:hypothetical protein AALP_AA3G044500 [Arabis alpina]|uniref:DUF3444 domain-containing protein n=1 Tax=Arabis alpina TaxID=50452 RepID=A0A087H702_ARAAL|nr:hypothetical protein AALP_AA3G044500 [Arabis alpina]